MNRGHKSNRMEVAEMAFNAEWQNNLYMLHSHALIIIQHHIITVTAQLIHTVAVIINYKSMNHFHG